MNPRVPTTGSRNQERSSPLKTDRVYERRLFIKIRGISGELQSRRLIMMMIRTLS
ncbi:unnamed protein product [Caenorhabditis brenneri]